MDIRFECPKCSQSMEMDEAGAGLQIFCPGCGSKLVVPRPKQPLVVPGSVRQHTVPAYKSLPRETITQRLEAMDWFQFEKLMAMIFELQKYRVTRRGGARPDRGIDLIVEKNNKRIGIQCKHWKSWKVGVRNVRELIGSLKTEKLDTGILVTIVGYTGEAYELGRQEGITLFDQGRILDLIDETGLRANPEFVKNLYDDRKYCPKCDVLLVLKTAGKGKRRGSNFWGCPNFPDCRYCVNV